MKLVLKSVIVFSLLILTGARLYADGTHPQGIKLDGTLSPSRGNTPLNPPSMG